MEEERVGALHFEPGVVLSRIVREQFVRHAFQLFAFGLCVFSRDACWFRAKGGINFSCSWLALSYLFLQFGDEDLE